MARPPPRIFMARRETYLRQIRLADDDPSNTSGHIMLRCNILANWISAKIEVTCSNFFSPKHDPTMVIFSLYSRPEKDKIINHPQFTTKLTEFKLKLLPPPREADETIIFVRNLLDSLYLF